MTYALGLYDYLAQSPAEQLTKYLLQLLKPGGRLVLANFVPDIIEAGYMEAFMRWKLIYRTPEELKSLTSLVPAWEIQAVDLWLDDVGSIGYLTMIRS